MSTEENKALIRRLSDEGWNKGNLNIADELVAANSISHIAGYPDIVGPEGFKQFVGMYLSAFTNMRWTTEDLIAEGDLVVERWSATATHTGNLMGIPPTGKSATVAGINISKIAKGKVVESWGNFDALGMLQQLGVIPAPGQ